MLLLQTVATAVANAVPVTDPGVTSNIDAFIHQAGLAGASVWLLEKLKRSNMFPWLSANSDSANKWAATALAFVAATAVQINITGGDAQHGWNGTFAIPSLHALSDGTFRFILQRMGQQGLYQFIYGRPVEVTPVLPEPMDSKGKPVNDK